MAATLSAMVPIGTKAHDFLLKDVISGNNISLYNSRGEIASVVMFICNHCPYVIHIYNHLAKLTSDYQAKGIAFFGINSNNYQAYPDDSPDKMKSLAQELGYKFPYMIDETQNVAKQYNATCTPDFFVFNKDLSLVYRGEYDNSRPNNGIPVTGNSLQLALDALISGQIPNHNQIPSIGCNIKWR